MKTLKEVMLEITDVNQREYDRFVAKYGFDSDPLTVLGYEPTDNTDGLLRILEASNPNYEVTR